MAFIEASWCPTCAKERPILAELMNDPAFKDLIILDVDFDTQKDVVRAMGATMQSTPVAFHGKDERGRMVGESGAEQRRLPGSLPPPGERLSLSSTAPPMMRILSTSRSGTQSDARS